MSGGSWDYVISRFREVGERLAIDSEANRRATVVRLEAELASAKGEAC
jgi:hypothetical protein